jgi:hypothetical protein
MSGDPLVTHFAQQSQRRREAWLLAAICDLWIWLNAVSALAFRLWVIDPVNYRAILEEKFWPCVFLIEGLMQLSLVVLVWLRLSKLPHNRDFKVFTATAAFSFLVNAIIVAAWTTAIFEEYQLAVIFSVFGSFLTIPAILFASYCALATPSPASLWIYAVTLTIALKCATLIPVKPHSQLVFIPYVAIILIALLSVVLPLRFAFAKTGPQIDHPVAP